MPKLPGSKQKLFPTIALDHLCEVTFKDVAVPAKNVLGKVDKGWAIVQMLIRKGSILKSAESLGGFRLLSI